MTSQRTIRERAERGEIEIVHVPDLSGRAWISVAAAAPKTTADSDFDYDDVDVFPHGPEADAEQ